MKRVAALYLPNWSIDRLRRAERHNVPPSAGAWAHSATAPVRGSESSRAAPRPAGAQSASDDMDFAHGATSGHGGGWRPGARWAKAELAAAIAALPAHQRPPVRELGRLSEAADHPFKRLPGDEGGTPNSSRPPDRHSREGRNPLWLPVRKAPHGLRQSTPGCAGMTAESVGQTISSLPLVTTHRIGSRVEIAAACGNARALGVAPGMPLTHARAQTSGLVVREADHDGDFADLQRLALVVARRFAPIVAIDGTAGLLIDITGTAQLHGGEAAMAHKLVRQLAARGYAARVAIAATPGAAHALARHASAAILVSDDDAAALAPLPVHALRIDPAQVELLHRLGLDTIGQLNQVARGPLARRFGAPVVVRLDQALGRLPEPLAPVVPPEPIAVQQRFPEPIATAEAIEHWLGMLVPQVTHALAAAGQGARRIEVIAERVDAVPQRIRIGLARPSRDPVHIMRLLVRRIGDIEPGYGIDAITLHMRAVDPLGPQALGPALAEETVPDLAPLIDTLATRSTALWRQQPVESDVPERSVAAAAPLDPPERSTPPLKPDDVRRLDLTAPLHPWHPRWPRPVRLLARPERLENVVALMPDGAPRRFSWRGRGHEVTRADGPERIAGEWWHRAGERVAVRDYFQVEDASGTRFWLYRRGDGERGVTGDLAWFLHGWFG